MNNTALFLTAPEQTSGDFYCDLLCDLYEQHQQIEEARRIIEKRTAAERWLTGEARHAWQRPIVAAVKSYLASRC